jgi:predicted lipid-binding transport protein (Tim44 family)
MQDGFDLSIVVFLLLAVFVGWRLYSVLGTRTERDEQSPPSSAFTRLKVVPQPEKEPVAPDQTPAEPDPLRWKGIAEPDSSLAMALDSLAAADRGFDVRQFISGARGAYEAIVMAFASGDRTTLRDLLSREVFESFVMAIADREKRGETVETTFVGIDKAEIRQVNLRGNTAHITINFVSKLITATRDAAGAVKDGATDKVVDVTDIWTFARELNSRDPVWKLIATEAAH